MREGTGSTRGCSAMCRPSDGLFLTPEGHLRSTGVKEDSSVIATRQLEAACYYAKSAPCLAHQALRSNPAGPEPFQAPRP